MAIETHDLEPGVYVVAVSGGVDSVALLHLLTKQPDLRLIVAHFDHGIRPDSHEDRLLVQEMAQQHGLPFVYAEGNLGPHASEETARKARYEFLHKTRQAAEADAIITAHHRDDALETAVINLIRGTGRKGLTSLQSVDGIKRPLLNVSKAELKAYAKKHNLQWREDSTNSDPAYLRNHIRHNILARLTEAERAELLQRVAAMRDINAELDAVLAEFLSVNTKDGKLNRHTLIMLPHALAREVMAAWLRQNNLRHFDKSMLERLVHAAKIYTVGRKVHVTGTTLLIIEKGFLALQPAER